MTKYTGGSGKKSDSIDEFRSIAENPIKLEYGLWTVEINSTHEVIGQAGFIPKQIKGKEYMEISSYECHSPTKELP